ncbi:coiled-coil domain-containing protein 102A isoform X2 [Leptopilina heterotoma]|uniref:coiled-coil domain-containing protein 102A isoform X2 n=1 Tax=Leptopilina heterotoma TaxID=63436 RepID=UPI001CA94E03|nr:coiled-coil domain-containing protein 102A isoform X2 [Leptopilina heterotoma]
MAQSSASGTSSRRLIRDNDVCPSGTTRFTDSDWETKEALRQRELEEARARAAQMEKTMRWWSDCTANWREKWSKVRNERNKSREEAKVLRTKLEIAIKDANTYKHEAQDVELQNEQLKKEMDKIHMILLKHAGKFDQQIVSILESDPQLRNALDIDELLEVYNNVEQSDNSTSIENKEYIIKSPTIDSESNNAENHNSSSDRDIEEYVLQGAVPKHAVELYKESSMVSLDRDIAKLVAEASTQNEKLNKRQSSLEIRNEEYLLQKMSMLQLRLEEATKTIAAEREEKSSLHRGVEKLKSEVAALRELQDSRTEAIKELLELKEKFQGELNAAQADLIDEASNREGMDRRLAELRTELEKLQVENAAEWGKRERLETEKICLERENKQLRGELRDLQEKVDSRRTRPVSTSDADGRILQQELLDRNKELVELKHGYSKMKKMFGDKTMELSHAIRRSEQYEAEVKRVRSRVEELKKELASAQDDMDVATNSVRKLQRTNECLVEQLEASNMQLEHFKNRVTTVNNTENCVAPDIVTEIKDEKIREEENEESRETSPVWRDI